MNRSYLILGSNMGNREKFLEMGISSLNEMNCKIAEKSSIYETEPWGYSDESKYLNQAVLVETSYSAFELLHLIQHIEQENDRVHTPQYSARTLDIDILFFNDDIVSTDKLTIPHIHIASRRFVLKPLSEIAANYMHPVYQMTISELLEKCTDRCLVKKIEDQ